MAYPSIKQGWGIIGISVLAMLIFSPVNILLNKYAGKEISFLVYYLLSMGATFWVIHIKRKKKTGYSTYNFESGSLKLIILISIATIAIQAGFTSPIISLLPMPEFMKKVFLELSKNKGLFTFLAIVLAAPLLEELIFRGIILNGFLKIYSPLKSVILSSVLFGIVHLNPWQFVGAFIIGMFAGWIYYKTKSLSLAILIHFVNNLCAFISMQFIDIEAMMNIPTIDFYGGILNFVLFTGGAIVVALICLYLIRSDFENKNREYSLLEFPV